MSENPPIDAKELIYLLGEKDVEIYQLRKMVEEREKAANLLAEELRKAESK